MHNMVTQNMTQKVDNSVPVITIGYNIAVENVSVLVGKTSCTIADGITGKVKDTNNMI